VPILVLALAQIGYWTAFFAAGPSGVGLALMRTVIRDVAGPWLPFAATVLAALLAWPFVSAAREPHR
jgi:hypothetical protein